CVTRNTSLPGGTAMASGMPGGLTASACGNASVSLGDSVSISFLLFFPSLARAPRTSDGFLKIAEAGRSRSYSYNSPLEPIMPGCQQASFGSRATTLTYGGRRHLRWRLGGFRSGSELLAPNLRRGVVVPPGGSPSGAVRARRAR